MRKSRSYGYIKTRGNVLIYLFSLLVASLILLLILWPTVAHNQTDTWPKQIEIKKPLDIKSEIIRLAKEYKVNPETALRIADCESDFNPTAKNKNSSAYGIFQFTAGTWKYTGGGDKDDINLQITRFMEWYPKYPSWWECK